MAGLILPAAPCTYVRSVFPQTPLYRKMLTGRAYIARQKSKRVKSAKNLSDGRNGFTESRFSEQENRYTEAFDNTRFETESHGTGKTVGVTYEQDITPAVLSGFDDNRNFYDTAKRMYWKAHLLHCFMI